MDNEQLHESCSHSLSRLHPLWPSIAQQIRLSNHGQLELEESFRGAVCYAAGVGERAGDDAVTDESISSNMYASTILFYPVIRRVLIRPVTIPSSAGDGVSIIPNIKDPQAVNAQDVCPGYKASNLQQGDKKLSATLTLAGTPCNVYGTDIQELNLNVEYQATGRLAVNIAPKNLVRG